MSDSESQVVRGLRRRGRQRVVSGESSPRNLGFTSFEPAQGLGIVGIPVECYRFVVGATEYRWTSADREITLASGVYTKEVISRDAVDFSQEDTAQNMAVFVSRENAIAQLFKAYNPTQPVNVTVIKRHRSGDPDEAVQFVGKVISCAFEEARAVLTCAPISHAFKRRVPSLAYQSPCNWNLYGPGCGVAKASFKISGTVLAVTGRTIQAAIFATKPDGWLSNGWVELANGERRFVVAHVGDVVTVASPFATIAAGAAIDGFAGCDRTEATCAAKFNNLVNHLGFPRIPTRNPYGSKLV